MIEDEKIEVALAVLNDDAEARAVFRKMRAEHKAEKIRAAAFLAATGPIEERKAKAVLDPDYQAALLELATEAGKLRKAGNDRDGAHSIVDVWEQQGHNIRAAERVR